MAILDEGKIDAIVSEIEIGKMTFEAAKNTFFKET